MKSYEHKIVAIVEVLSSWWPETHAALKTQAAFEILTKLERIEEGRDETPRNKPYQSA